MRSVKDCQVDLLLSTFLGCPRLPWECGAGPGISTQLGLGNIPRSMGQLADQFYSLISKLSPLAAFADCNYGKRAIHRAVNTHIVIASVSYIVGDAFRVRQKLAVELAEHKAGEIRYRALFDHTNDGIFLIGLDKIIQTAKTPDYSKTS